MSRFQRIEYGFFGSGLKNVMPCPRKVLIPAVAPVGGMMPVGKGFDSVTAGRRFPVVPDPSTFVVELKPGALMPCVPIDETNTPAPPRTTRFRPAPPGLQANPKRGLK